MIFSRLLTVAAQPDVLRTLRFPSLAGISRICHFHLAHPYWIGRFHFRGLKRRIELVDLNHPSITVALPIVIAMIVSAFASIRSLSKSMDTMNKRLDDLRSDINARFGDMNTRFDAIDRRLDKLEEKVERLQERAWR
jgi:tetrahydromethanopterin S-methyltransferase subunit G